MMKNTFAVATICTTRYDKHTKVTRCQLNLPHKTIQNTNNKIN